MKTLRKRLTCANRGGDLEGCRKNKEAMDKIQSRYVAKMEAKGWSLEDGTGNPTEGNAMFKWERYITLVK